MKILEKYSGIPKATRKRWKISFRNTIRNQDRFAVEPPNLTWLPSIPIWQETLKLHTKLPSVSRIVPRATYKWANKFDVGQKAIVRRSRKEPVSEIESTIWFGPFIVKKQNNPICRLRTDDCRKFGARFTQDD